MDPAIAKYSVHDIQKCSCEDREIFLIIYQYVSKMTKSYTTEGSITRGVPFWITTLILPV